MQRATSGKVGNRASARNCTVAISSRGQQCHGFPAADTCVDSLRNKLVFVGNPGSGKTTAIESLSDVAPASIRMPAGSGQDAAEFTLDYTTARLDDGRPLHVYGVPGEKHLDFVWSMTCDGATGVLVLVNACDPQRLAFTTSMLDEFSRLAPGASFTVGVTCSDRAPGFTLNGFRNALAAKGFRLPVVKVDAREPAQVRFLAKILLSGRPAGRPWPRA